MMAVIGRPAILAAILLLSATVAAAYIWYESPQEQAKRNVRLSLLDPDSAKFAHLETCRGSEGLDYVSGYINAKNTFGGYTGDRFFVSYFVNGGGLGAVETEEGPDDKTSVAAWVKSLQSRAQTAEALGAPAEPLHDCDAMDDFARENAGSSTLEYSRQRLDRAIQALRGS